MGHGLPIGLGMALGAKLKNKKWKTYVLLSDGELDKHHLNHAHLLGKIPFIQITKQSDICRILSPTCFSVSAERFFGHQS